MIFPGTNGQPVRLPVYDLRTIPGGSGHALPPGMNNDPSSYDVIFVPPGMENVNISGNFKISEFQSGIPKIGPDGKVERDAQGNPVSIGKDPFLRLDPKLVEQLETLRVAFGGEPIKIISGYRTQAWNEAVGGVPGSQHLTGKAADFQVRGVSPADVYDYLDQFPGGLGKYSGFTHYDVGPTREW